MYSPCVSHVKAVPKLPSVSCSSCPLWCLNTIRFHLFRQNNSSKIHCGMNALKGGTDIMAIIV